MVEKSYKGLVKKKVTVKRGGKTFERYQWVKAGEDEPKEKPSKKEEIKSIKGKFNIGDLIKFMGKDLTIEKVSESQKTVKLSDNNVYTFGAIEKFSKIVKDKKEEKLSVKDLKVPKKKLKKEVKILPGIPITKNNIEETLKIGSKIEIYGKSAIVTNNNNNMIIGYEFQDGEKGMGSPSWLIEDGKPKTRAENEEDKKKAAEELKKVEVAEKKISDREKQFKKIIKGKYTNNKEQDKIISNTINKLDDLLSKGELLDSAVKKITKSKTGTYKPKINLPEFEKSDKKELNSGIKKLNQYISPKYKELNNIKLVTCSTGRSYASPEENKIYLDNGLDIDSTIMHETGHLIETNYPKNKKVIDDFLRSRTGNLKNQQKLNEIIPESGYANNEMTCKDDFIDPYIGKIYYKPSKKNEIDTKDLRSTEVLSMGIEAFSDKKSMKEFYKNDKEHFALTLSIMAGDFIE